MPDETPPNGIEKRLEDIESRLAAVSRKRELAIGIGAALVAAFASIAGAWLGFVGTQRSLDVQTSLAQAQSQLEKERAFAQHGLDMERFRGERYVAELAIFEKLAEWITLGRDDERKRALALVSGLPGELFVAVGNALASDEEMRATLVAAADRKSPPPIRPIVLESKPLAGRKAQCGRATRLTRLRLKNPGAADEMCAKVNAIGSDYVGPWEDGSVSIKLAASLEGFEVWRNCVPT